MIRIQETDGSYFESFTALAWKQENQRQSVMKEAEASISEAPPQESEFGISAIDHSLPQNEKDKLYVEMLYTIANAVRNYYYYFFFASYNIQICFSFLLSSFLRLFSLFIKYYTFKYNFVILTTAYFLFIYIKCYLIIFVLAFLASKNYYFLFDNPVERALNYNFNFIFILYNHS